MGHVQRIVFRFRERFWENLDDDPVSFLHAGPDTYFPTWWTQHPMRTPHLVGWQGGPKAEEIGHWREDEKITSALKTLSKLTGRSFTFLNSQVQSWHSHNWTEDPHTLGAYSYVAAGGMQAAKLFRRPIEDTLVFAGEAAAVGTERGTVHGAFDSGLNAARGFFPL